MRARLASAVLISLVVAAPAAADLARFPDPNDTDGKLDVRSAVQGHRTADSGPPMIRHRLTMYEPWGKRALTRRSNFIAMFLDVDDDEGFERRLMIDVRNGKFRAKMERWRDLEDVGFADVWRPNRRSISVAFPKTWLGAGVRSYEWLANTIYGIEGEGPCGLQTDVYTWCTDSVPNRGRYTHSL